MPLLKKIAVSGYKSYELGIFQENDIKVGFIKSALKKRLLQLIEEGLEWVLLSGQLGVELWAAQSVQELQADGWNIQLGVIPPFENQESRWSDEMKMIYEEVCAVADFCQPLYKGEYKGPYQFKARDKWLIDKTDGCLLLLDEENPASVRFFHEEAKKTRSRKNYEIMLITPFDLDEIVQEIQMNDPDFWT